MNRIQKAYYSVGGLIAGGGMVYSIHCETFAPCVMTIVLSFCLVFLGIAHTE